MSLGIIYRVSRTLEGEGDSLWAGSLVSDVSAVRTADDIMDQGAKLPGRLLLHIPSVTFGVGGDLLTGVQAEWS